MQQLWIKLEIKSNRFLTKELRFSKGVEKIQARKAAFKSLMKISISSSSYVSDNTNWLIMHVDEFGSLHNGDDLE
ncbi:2344_t:CDS:2, partial [Entrophospora sp. SA101]